MHETAKEAATKEARDIVRSLYSECHDAITEATDLIDLIGWVEIQRIEGVRVSNNRVAVALLIAVTSDVMASVVEASKERDRKLDDWMLYRNRVLTIFHERGVKELSKF